MSIDAMFIKIVNISISASWLILAVILLRLLLKRAPKWIFCVLWALVAVRLICPCSLESTLSLIPSSETIPEEILFYEGNQQYVPAWIDVVDNPAFSQSVSLPTGQPVSVVQSRFVFWTLIWLAGMAALLAYALISFRRLKKNVSASINIRDNIFACDEVQSPFILGIVKPLIYVPSSIKGDTLEYVTAHEQAHIRRRDHWWKPLGYLLLSVYWFNPLCWLAYIMLCRDIELACDEKVIRSMNRSDKASYSQALLNCSFSRKRIAACPVAFGEVGVKERVRSVLNYKKPAFWLVIAAVAVCIVTAVCFLTNPKRDKSDDVTGYYVCEQEGFGGSFYIDLKKDGTFEYYEGCLSSYIGMGKWEYDGSAVVLIDNTFEDERRTYFTAGENSLAFIKDSSDRFIYVDLADGTRFIKQNSTKETEADTEESHSDNLSADDYFTPDYASMNKAHSDEFLKVLKRDGYYTDGKLDRSYNTDGITDVVNITPKGISDETSDIEIFLIKDAEHCFLMANGVIYRYETFGGYHHMLCLWDYDGNGTKDLVSYDSFGSGIPYLGVSIFNVTTTEFVEVITKNLLEDSEFSFGYKDGNVYIDGGKLVYNDATSTFNIENSNVSQPNVDDVMRSITGEYGNNPADVIACLNEIRESYGLPGYREGNDDLRCAAAIRAAECAGQTQHNSHNRPDGTPYDTVFYETGVSCSVSDELIGIGQASARQFAAEAYCAENLDPRCDTIAVEMSEAADGTMIWVIEAISE